jgi:competence protein ComFC
VRLASALATVADWILPRHCRLCETPAAEAMCAACRANLEVIHGPVCEQCGALLTPEGAALARCAACRTSGGSRAPAVGVCAFRGLARRAVHQLKYGGVTALAAPMAAVMAGWVAARSAVAGTDGGRGGAFGLLARGEADVVLGVPLHPRRERERGFNQSALLAAELGRLLQLPDAAHALERVRETPPQVGLDARDRGANVRRAFEVADARPIDGRIVLLVDDVLTTGATLHECAETLRRAGADRVVGLAFARQTVDDPVQPGGDSGVS